MMPSLLLQLFSFRIMEEIYQYWTKLLELMKNISKFTSNNNNNNNKLI